MGTRASDAGFHDMTGDVEVDWLIETSGRHPRAACRSFSRCRSIDRAWGGCVFDVDAVVAALEATRSDQGGRR